MVITKKSRLFGVILIALGAGCGESGDEEETDGGIPGLNSQNRKVLAKPKVTPPVESNAPDNFKGSFKLAKLALTNPEEYEKQKKFQLDSLADACNSQYNRETETVKWDGCRAAAQVKEEFFLGQGPTDVAGLTAQIDSRMTDIFRNADWSYMPCFDEQNVAGGTYQEFEESSNSHVEKTYPAFKSHTWSGTYTFEDGGTYKSGMDAHLSCYMDLGNTPNGGKAWVGFGRKDGDYYILEGQDTGTGSLAKVAKNGDVEMLMGVGPKPSSFPSNFTEELAVFNSLSTGLVHLKSYADTGLMELTVAGMGPAGCRTHFISNGKMMYIEMNQNEYGACSATDTGIGATSKRNSPGTRAYDATYDNKAFCLDVSSTDNIKAYDTVEPCTDQGLTASAFKLSTIQRDSFKGFYGTYMFSSDPSADIPLVQFISVAEDNIEGTDSLTEALTIVEETNSKIDTACSTAAADKKDVSLSYKLDVAALLAEQVNRAKTSPNKSEDFDEGSYRQLMLRSLQGATGASPAEMKFTVAASAGGVKWADFDLAVSLKLDGNELGSGSYVENEDHVIGAQPISLNADLAGITETSTLTLTGTGTLQLGCSNAGNTIKTAASLRLGFPRLRYTQLPPED